jgi:hypothetical protein
MERLIWQCRTSNQKAAHGTAMHVAASRRCDFARRGRVVEVSSGTLLPAASELNPLATHAPWGLMQRLSPLHECGGAVGQRTVRRVYVRFRPTEKFRQHVLNVHLKEGASE